MFARLIIFLRRFRGFKNLIYKISTLTSLYGLRYLLIRLKENIEIVIWGSKYEQGLPSWYRKYVNSERNEPSGWKTGDLKFSVIIPTFEPKISHFKKAIQSVLEQTYENWEVCIFDNGTTNKKFRNYLKLLSRDFRFVKAGSETNRGIANATNYAAKIASGNFLVFLDQDDELAPNALMQLSIAISRNPNLKYVYSDEIKISNTGKPISHHFKSDLNIELAWAYNYFCHVAAISAKLFMKLGGMRAEFDGAQDYDLALRVIDSVPLSEIHHIDKVLYKWRVHNGSTSSDAKNKLYAVEAGMATLRERLVRKKINGMIQYSSIRNQQWYEFIPDLPIDKPLVSVIILTRDRLSFLERAVESVLQNNSYESFELIIVDNGSIESETFEFLEAIQSHPRVSVVHDESEFNYSYLNNLAASIAVGELLLFLNNDIQALESNWMTELVRVILQEGVAVSGAKLYYPDGTIQHAGVILGLGGVAGHSHRNAAPGAVGYLGRIEVCQQLSAVTGACMMVRKDAFFDVGGFTEDLAVSFNDVDLCLKIGSTGRRIVYNPRAALIHHESISRGKDLRPDQIARARAEESYMKEKWPQAINRDPFYNINLTRETEDWGLAKITKKPPKV